MVFSPLCLYIKKMIDYSDLGVVWYAMKTTYKKERKAQEYLDALGIENFIPMRQAIETKHGKKRVALVPAVHNLIFVKTDLATLITIKKELNYLHNRLMRDGDKSLPIIVPSGQMDQFIDAMTHHLEKVIYIDLTDAQLEKGTPVRVTDGDFKGYEGVLEKIKGKRDRVVHVIIKGVAAYKFEVRACDIEKM